MRSDRADAPFFSVVIPTWNRADLICRAVDSVLAQTFTDFELIVVDDGSTDATREKVAGTPDPRVRLLPRDHHGVGATRNAGAAEARGGFVTFLDSDDEALPTWLAQLATPLRARTADVAVCGAVMVGAGGDHSPFAPDAGALGPDAIAPHFLAGCFAMAKDRFAAVGGYDPALRFGENTELALRLFTQDPGLRFAAVSEPLVWVRSRQPGTLDPGVRPESARVVLSRYRPQRSDFPRLWASYHAIVGVDWARRRHPWQARRHFAAALAADPRSWEHVRRMAVSLIPGVTRRLWPPSPPGWDG